MQESLNDPALMNRELGPVTIFFGRDNGKYPHGNSLVIRGEKDSAIIDPCLGVVARPAAQRPVVDKVIHSHAHEDHIAGTHLFPNVPWHVHEADALGLESIHGLMKIYGLDPELSRDFFREIQTTFHYPNPQGSIEVEKFVDGDVFDFGGVTLKVIHTPGHTRGHCCFLIEWGAGHDERLVYLGDIELTGFGPYYGDAWSDLEDFERSIDRLRELDAKWWLTFHHKGLIESREQFLVMLTSFASMIQDREARLLAYLDRPRTMAEIVEHRFVYRPGQTGFMVDEVERRSMTMHLQRLERQNRVQQIEDRYFAC